MTMPTNKNVMYAGGSALVLAAIVGGYLWYRSSSVQVTVSPDNAGSPAASADDSTVPAPAGEQPATAPAPTTGGGTTATGSVTPSYAEALKTYGTSGYRYQFLNCRGTPGKLVVKRGQKFMIDNRDAKAHKFVVQGRTFTVGKLGFAIVTASTVGTSKITCDGGGAADLVVQR